MTTKVYRYGLLPPIFGLYACEEQLHRAHAYRNVLVELSREERALVRKAELDAGLRVAHLAVKRTQQALNDLLTEAKREKSRTRKRQVPGALRALIAEARDARRKAGKAHSEARKEIKKVIDRDAIREAYLVKTKAARKASGVYWGTYQVAEDAHEQAEKDVPMWDRGEPGDLGYRRWTGDGRLSVQVVNGASWDELRAGNGVARIVAAQPAPGADPQSRRSALRQRWLLDLRVGKTRERAVFPMLMHRPLPEDARVMRITVHRKKIGPRDQWYATFTVRSDRLRKPAATLPGTRVAMDVGWRKMDDALRVVRWRTDTGETGEERVPTEILEQICYADVIRSLRDKSMDSAKALLAAQLDALFSDPQRGEAATQSATSTAIAAYTEAKKQGLRGADLHVYVKALRVAREAQFPPQKKQRAAGATVVRDVRYLFLDWRAVGRFVKLYRLWAELRFPGDEEAFEALEAWLADDHHLWVWEASQRTKGLRRRKDYYRTFASRIARRYDVLVLEDFDLREVAKRPEVEKQEGDNPEARAQRQQASVSELRDALRNAFGGDRVREVDPAFTTSTCAACGSDEVWDQAKELEHTCEACGSHWDQDDNACKNMLRIDGERGEEQRAESATRSALTKWARRREEKAEKERQRAEGATTSRGGGLSTGGLFEEATQ